MENEVLNPEASAADLQADSAGVAMAPPPGAPPVPTVDAALPPPAEAGPPDNKRWYVVKVQSGREESIRNAIERRVKIEGLQECFGRIVIPTEKYTDMVRNKRVVKERKLFPGYLMVNVEYNDRILYLFRETSGVGDFVGAGLNKAPQPMKASEVDSMLAKIDADFKPTAEPAKPKFDKGDRVKVKDGPFAGMEGEVKELLETKNLVRVEITIFGRGVSVELEYWQVEEV
jgi:transcription termination/antitermination protein NusG